MLFEEVVCYWLTNFHVTPMKIAVVTEIRLRDLVRYSG